MSGAATNPHALIAQYRKARKIADVLYDLGLRDDVQWEGLLGFIDLQSLTRAADLASPPSDATLALACILVGEYADEEELQDA